MKIFRRERQSLRIKKAKTSRAVFHSPEIQEIEITLVTEENDRLDLQLGPDTARQMIVELTTAYQAIRPPLSSGNYQAMWQGMDND